MLVLKDIYESEDENLIFGVNNCVDSMQAILKKQQKQGRDTETIKKLGWGGLIKNDDYLI